MADTQQQPSIRPGSVLEGKKSKPFQVVGFALRRGPLIFLLGGLLFLLLLPLLMQRASPIYETDALLLLDPAKEPTLTGRERDAIPGTIADYMRTLVNRINSHDVLAEALSRLDPAEYPAFLNPDHPLERNVHRLMSRIRVREVLRTYLISLTITADQPQGLGPVLNQVMLVFVEKIQAEQERQYERRLSYLRDERDKLLARLDDERNALLVLAEGMDQKAFLHETYSLHVYKQDMIQRLFWEAEAKHSEQLSLLEKALADREAVRQLDLQPFADERVADNFGINRIEQWTYEQLQSLRTSIDGLTPSNPDRIYVEERMRAMNAFLESYKQQVNEETIRNIREKLEYELDLDVIRARSSYEAAKSNANRLKILLDQATVEAAETSEAIYLASEILFSMEQLRSRLAALNNRIDDSEMEAKAPVRLDIDKWAVSPVEPARTNTKSLGMMALALSFGSVFGFIFVFDFLDNRLREPEEVTKGLGGSGPAPIWHMGLEDVESGNIAEASLVNPLAPAVQAMRSLAVRLEREREKHGAKVVALAGLNPACGVSSLALNLAHILRFGCERVLVLECNLLRPGMARLERGLKEAPGLWELLSDLEVDDWKTAVQHDAQRRIDVITAGRPLPLLPSRARLLTLLNQVRQDYDMVLLDVAPVLEDEFSSHAAMHADAVLLVGREDVSLFRDLRQSIDLLVQAEVPAVSAVLNFVRPKRSEQIRTIMQHHMQFISSVHRKLHSMVRRTLRRAPR
ncbi:GumC family protein [Desulfonatronum parangueonense]